MKSNLVLYGFMGAGKSSVARRLAEAHGMEAMDTDHIIEEQEGAPIPEIFRERGETYFRGIERDVVRFLARRKGQVIATGGGVPLDETNITELDRTGVGIYLRARPGTLARRLAEVTDRPLLPKGADAASIQKLLASRRAAYARISHVMDTDRLTLGQVSQRAWELYSELKDADGAEEKFDD